MCTPSLSLSYAECVGLKAIPGAVLFVLYVILLGAFFAFK